MRNQLYVIKSDLKRDYMDGNNTGGQVNLQLVNEEGTLLLRFGSEGYQGTRRMYCGIGHPILRISLTLYKGFFYRTVEELDRDIDEQLEVQLPHLQYSMPYDLWAIKTAIMVGYELLRQCKPSHNAATLESPIDITNMMGTKFE